MRTLFCILLVTTSAITLTNCDQCENDDPPDDALKAFVLSPTGRNLIGDDPTQYAANSLDVTTDAGTVSFTVPYEALNDKGAFIRLIPVNASSKKSGTIQLFLRLSQTDVDTLVVTYETNHSRCFDLLQYNSVFYNGQRMGQDGTGFYQLIKR